MHKQENGDALSTHLLHSFRFYSRRNCTQKTRLIRVDVVVQRVGSFLQDVLHEYDGKTIVVIGHRATKYGLEYWRSSDTLEEIVNKKWEWRDVPVWCYEVSFSTFARG